MADLADRLSVFEPELWPSAARAAVKLGPAGGFTRLSPLFAGESDAESDPKIEAALAALEPGADPRWFEFLLAKSRGRPCLETALAIDGLAKLGDRRAIPALVALLPHAPDRIAHRIIFALAAFRDPRTCRPILARCGDTILLMLAASAAMHCIGRPALPALRRAAKSARGPTKRLLSGLIKDISSASSA